MTVDRTAAVAHGGALGAVTLDDAGVALALADAGAVHMIALGEHVGPDDIAHVDGGAVVQAELLEHLQGLSARLGQVAQLRLGELALGDGLEAHLHGLIAVVLEGLLLHHGAGAGLDDGHGDDLAVGVKDLRHADLFADDCLFHLVFSSL